MLKLAPEPLFTVSVAIPVPGADDVLVNCTFRHMGVAALRAWSESNAGREDLDVIADVLAGWAGIDAEYSRDTLAALLDAYPGAAVSLATAYRRELVKAAAKN